MNKEEIQAMNRITRLYENSLDINKTPVVLTEDTRCMGILLNLVDKQNKIIDLMAEELSNIEQFNAEGIKQYFEDKLL